MNVPAIAKKSFEQLKSIPEFKVIIQSVVDHLTKLTSPIKRARYIHKLVDQYNLEVFSHPLVKQLSPCKQGCSACCHTQVSVTDEEAHLLLDRIEKGVEIDFERLNLQMNAGNDSNAFYQLSYDIRKCVFLDQTGNCQVYNDRPSVCRTNAVIGPAIQCDTKVSPQPTRLVLTQKSDMVIYASFLSSQKSGALPYMIGTLRKARESKVS